MKRALLCSGQGRLERDMLDIFAGIEAAAPVFRAASEVLGRDPRDLLAEAGEDVLLENRTSQILCITRALAAAACLSLDGFAYVAGYSVGEMAAWGIAGVWDAGHCLALTAKRAECMNAADHDGGLGFVRGLDAATVERLVADYGCAIAIRNPRQLFIIGGARDAVAACCTAALAIGAVSAHPIAVRVASHTPRLASAVAPFLQALAGVEAATPGAHAILVTATDARIVSDARAAMVGLAGQLAHTVDWDAVLNALVERGVGRMLELGPGSALADMVRGAFPDVEVRAVDDFRTIEGARTWFAAA